MGRGIGLRGIQIPTWDRRLFDLQRAAESQAYCDEVLGIAAGAGVGMTELSTHLQGHLVAAHSAYDAQLDDFAPAELAGDAKAKSEWAVQQLRWAAPSKPQAGPDRRMPRFQERWRGRSFIPVRSGRQD